MHRLIVTGSNGTGKSHFAERLAAVRPDLPLKSYDEIRLTENWRKRAPPEIDELMSAALSRDAWIFEGGPSLLKMTLPRCEGVIWLDPPEVQRAWRLALRPWRNFGRVRPELPQGNVDWPLEQYRFAFQSLRKGAKFRHTIESQLRMYPNMKIWRCREQKDIEAAIKMLSANIANFVDVERDCGNGRNLE